MTSTISIRLKKDLVKDLHKIESEWQADRSETVRRLLVSSVKGWKIKNALEKLSGHKISIGKASEMCGITVWEMLELAKEHNVDWVQYGAEDLEEETDDL